MKKTANCFQALATKDMQIGYFCIAHNAEEGHDEETTTASEDGICLTTKRTELGEECTSLSLHELNEEGEVGESESKSEVVKEM